MKILMLPLVYLFSCTLVFSQQLPRQVISLSYYGEMVKHPGVSVEVSQNLVPVKTEDPAALKHLFQVGLRLAYYSHTKSHFAFRITPHAGYQFLFKRGFMLRANLDAGYMHQFNYGSTYEVLNSNTVEEIKWAGRSKFTASFSLGIGRNYFKTKNIPWAWHADLGVFTESPTNTGFIPHVFLNAGVDYYFNFKKK